MTGIKVAVLNKATIRYHISTQRGKNLVYEST